MNQHPISRALVALALGVVAVTSTCPLYAQSLDEILGVRQATTQDGRRAQARINEIKDQTQDLLSQYKQVMKTVDGLRVYNKQQERLIQNQETQMSELNTSIDNVTVIERQIGPLIKRMIDGLDKFIDLDVPFLMKERKNRIKFLRDTLDRSDVSIAEKLSQVLQAYQIEDTYGSTIESYTDYINLNGKNREVNMLRWGRVALVFQTPDGEITGAWDQKSRSWKILSDDYTSEVRKALRIANKSQAADLVILPVPAPEPESNSESN